MWRHKNSVEVSRLYDLLSAAQVGDTQRPTLWPLHIFNTFSVFWMFLVDSLRSVGVKPPASKSVSGGTFYKRINQVIMRERRGSVTSCLLCPQSVHASLLHCGSEGWREAGPTQPPPPAPLPPGRDLWPRGSAVGADGLQRFTATDLLTQRRLLGGRTYTFTHWHL